MSKILNPEKYNMAICPVCNGKGRLPKHPRGFEVCSKCGGFGFVKKEPEEDVNTSHVTKGGRTPTMIVKI